MNTRQRKPKREKQVIIFENNLELETESEDDQMSGREEELGENGQSVRPPLRKKAKYDFPQTAFVTLELGKMGPEECDNHDKKLDKATCIISDLHCDGPIINGCCRAHGIHFNVIYHAFSIIGQRDLEIMPCADKTVNNGPQRKFPLTTITGFVPREEYLKYAQSEGSIALGVADFFHQGTCDLNKLTNNQKNEITTKVIFLNTKFTSWYRKNEEILKNFFVYCWFTKDFVPKTKKAAVIYKHAVKLDNDKNQMSYVKVNLSYFNIIDLLHLSSYKMSQFSPHVGSNIEIGFMPNCQIVDGWVIHGIGFGVIKIPPTCKTVYCGHVMPESVKANFIKNQHKIIHPLILEGNSPISHNLLFCETGDNPDKSLDVPIELDNVYMDNTYYYGSSSQQNNKKK